MPNWLKQLLLGLFTGLAAFGGAILDEIVKVDTMSQIADVSWYAAAFTGGIMAVGIWRAAIAQSIK